jgi:hypothetical protein
MKEAKKKFDKLQDEERTKYEKLKMQRERKRRRHNEMVNEVVRANKAAGWSRHQFLRPRNYRREKESSSSEEGDEESEESEFEEEIFDYPETFEGVIKDVSDYLKLRLNVMTEELNFKKIVQTEDQSFAQYVSLLRERVAHFEERPDEAERKVLGQITVHASLWRIRLEALSPEVTVEQLLKLAVQLEHSVEQEAYRVKVTAATARAEAVKAEMSEEVAAVTTANWQRTGDYNSKDFGPAGSYKRQVDNYRGNASADSSGRGGAAGGWYGSNRFNQGSMATGGGGDRQGRQGEGGRAFDFSGRAYGQSRADGGSRERARVVDCYACGRRGHMSRDKVCPARDRQCLTCGRVGHFRVVCREAEKKTEDVKVEQKKDEKDRELSHVEGVPEITSSGVQVKKIMKQNVAEREWAMGEYVICQVDFIEKKRNEIVRCAINGLLVEVLVDSGSPIDILTEYTANQINGLVTIEKECGRKFKSLASKEFLIVKKNGESGSRNRGTGS